MSYGEYGMDVKFSFEHNSAVIGVVHLANSAGTVAEKNM